MWKEIRTSHLISSDPVDFKIRKEQNIVQVTSDVQSVNIYFKPEALSGICRRACFLTHSLANINHNTNSLVYQIIHAI